MNSCLTFALRLFGLLTLCHLNFSSTHKHRTCSDVMSISTHLHTCRQHTALQVLLRPCLPFHPLCLIPRKEMRSVKGCREDQQLSEETDCKWSALFFKSLIGVLYSCTFLYLFICFCNIIMCFFVGIFFISLYSLSAGSILSPTGGFSVRLGLLLHL